MTWHTLDEVYMGDWKDDLPHGKGEHIWGKFHVFFFFFFLHVNLCFDMFILHDSNLLLALFINIIYYDRKKI